MFTNITWFDRRGLTPAPVIPFALEDVTDYSTSQSLNSWLSSIDRVEGDK
jgi:hypothetical protein